MKKCLQFDMSTFIETLPIVNLKACVHGEIETKLPTHLLYHHFKINIVPT